jgi:phosphoglycolate phosphatase
MALPCDALLSRDDVSRVKPDPEHLFAALRALGLPDGRSPSLSPRSPCIMVGDHWMDIQAGRAAGMGTIGIGRGRGPEAFAPAPPDLLAEELADLAAFF